MYEFSIINSGFQKQKKTLAQITFIIYTQIRELTIPAYCVIFIFPLIYKGLR